MPPSAPQYEPDQAVIAKQNPPYLVQVGKGRGAYTTRWTFDSFGRAFMHYSGLNTHSGYKKRLVDGNGRVISRVIT